MSDIKLPQIERVQVVTPAPGDVLIVTVPADTHHDAFVTLVDAISERFKVLFPDCEVLFLGGDVKVRVVRPDGSG